MDSAMDLSLRNDSSTPLIQTANPVMSEIPKMPLTENCTGTQIVRPIPRPPWSIVWYQNLWSISSSVSDQTTPKSESDCGETSIYENKSKINIRTNERSSFSVLNNLSTNTITNSFDNNNSNYHYASSEDHQQLQHRLFQLPMDKCCTTVSEIDSVLTAPSSSHFKCKQHMDIMTDVHSHRTDLSQSEDNCDSDDSENIVVTTQSSCQQQKDRSSNIKSSSSTSMDKSYISSSTSGNHEHHQAHQTTVILDVACCDGPVQFKRVSNPNFALTVEHNEVSPPSLPTGERKALLAPNSAAYQQQNHGKHDDQHADRSDLATTTEGGKHLSIPHYSSTTECSSAVATPAAETSSTVTTHKSYLCIYCNQSFKSLFCYQKHKKRHLNPVSVDITTTANSTSYRGSSGIGSSHKKGNSGGGASSSDCGGGVGGGGNIGNIPENAKAKTKDLNVQFFPCKKCGCKFPSYYFVHKHRKICH